MPEKSESTHLVRPTMAYKNSVIAAMHEFKADGHHRYNELDINSVEQHFDAYVAREYDEQPPGNWVPNTIYWLVDDVPPEQGGAFIGRISLRHYLNESLRNFGGHIGYEIRPSRRRQGHGTRMLALLLEICRERGMDKVMLTCDDDNTGSQKIIKNNGGVLEDVRKLPTRKQPVMRWWITLV